jgi:hypothetical protein
MLGKNIAALVALQALLAMPATATADDADSLEQFHADGIGAVVFGSTLVGDQAPQTAYIKGTFVGGNALLTFTLLNGSTGMNGTGAYCAYKSGTAHIVATDGKTIDMTLAGVGCNGPSGTGTGNTEVTYVITGGTKWNISATAGGTGRFSWGYESSHVMFVQFDGNIKLSEE